MIEPPTPAATLSQALVPTRSLLIYTVLATVPILLIVGLLLSGRASTAVLITASYACFGASLFGLLLLLYELTLDVAGYPNYKLPVWSVLYLIVYLLSGFAFLFFGLHSAAPGRYFTGLNTTPTCVFLDSIYLSLSNFVGMSPDSSISIKSRSARFISLTECVIAMFINVVIITKFVNGF
jgi:hypothetical protein